MIVKNKPTTIEDLAKIKGVGEKKSKMFGAEIVEFIKNNSIETTNQPNNFDKNLYDLLISERPKIANFNNLSEEDVYSDKVAEYLTKMKPTDKGALNKIYGFKKENIEKFGDYLTRVISRNIKK